MTKRVRKRQYGSGAVVAPTKPGGTWAIRYRVGKERRYQGGIPTREMAERALAKLQVDDAADTLGLPKRASSVGVIGDYAPAFLARRRRTHSASRRQNASQWRLHIGPVFDHLQPAEVDSGTIRRFIDTCAEKGLSAGSIRVMVALLSALYEELVEDGLVAKNPARGLPRRVLRLMTSTHDPRTVPFVERLGDVQRIYSDLPSPLCVGYALGALAGLRTGEVFGLRWCHVDLVQRRIHVREQRGETLDGGPRMLKDKESRVVPILDALYPVLVAWHLETGGPPNGLVVPPSRPGAKYVHQDVPGKYLRQTLERLGLARPGLGWYEATRHTFASQWVLNGGAIEKLREILGHSTVAMTERYAHLRVDLFTAKDFATLPAVMSVAGAAVVQFDNGPGLGRAAETVSLTTRRSK